jgi:uncharacterized protein YgiM (DUF1202 family)
MKAFGVGAAIVFILLLAACGGPAREPAIGEAYVGPVTIQLREELSAKSPLVATLRHGERVEIVNRRRRFFKVRNRQGLAGWTDGRQLITQEEMDELSEQAALAKDLPPQGSAFVYEPLNVHTKPNRQAPSFYQLKAKETAEVLTFRLEPRLPYESPILRKEETAEPKPKARAKKKAEPKVPPVPRAKPPGLPPDYDVISQQPPQDPEYLLKRQEREEARKASIPIEEWSLIRLGDGRIGWVLSGMIVMAIPDEVAQYAEGHRITSYFSLGEVRDGDKVKHNWLWTTLGSRNVPHQFDSFRVFVWSRSRHRYETAYIERNLAGYQPVTVGTVPYNDGRGERSVPSFSIIARNKEGNVVRRTFAFAGQFVRQVKSEPWEVPPPFRPQTGRAAAEPVAAPKPEAPSLPARLTEQFRGLRERWSGR